VKIFKLAALTYKVLASGSQLTCLPYVCHTILSILFVPQISCFSSGFPTKLILVCMPFSLLLLLLRIHYLTLSGLLLLYILLGLLSKLTISTPPSSQFFTSCLHPHL